MTSRSPFDALVGAYDAGRPSYPDELYDTVESLTRPLRDSQVVEIGAGTGIATRELVRRGASVVALDIGEQMLRRLRHNLPGQRVALARAEALPVRSDTADLVCAAQAWHWVDVAQAAPEVRRVLKPDGALAVWWNNVDAGGVPWFEAQQQRLEAMSPGYRREYRSDPAEVALAPYFDDVVVRTMRWSRTLSLDEYEVWLRSKSYVAAIGDGLDEFLAAERASLAAAFPDGHVVEPFEVRLVLALI